MKTDGATVSRDENAAQILADGIIKDSRVLYDIGDIKGVVVNRKQELSAIAISAVIVFAVVATRGAHISRWHLNPPDSASPNPDIAMSGDQSSPAAVDNGSHTVSHPGIDRSDRSADSPPLSVMPLPSEELVQLRLQDSNAYFHVAQRQRRLAGTVDSTGGNDTALLPEEREAAATERVAKRVLKRLEEKNER